LSSFYQLSHYDCPRNDVRKISEDHAPISGII
jgi:hypothetical protein